MIIYMRKKSDSTGKTAHSRGQFYAFVRILLMRKKLCEWGFKGFGWLCTLPALANFRTTNGAWVACSTLVKKFILLRNLVQNHLVAVFFGHAHWNCYSLFSTFWMSALRTTSLHILDYEKVFLWRFMGNLDESDVVLFPNSAYFSNE